MGERKVRVHLGVISLKRDRKDTLPKTGPVITGGITV